MYKVNDTVVYGAQGVCKIAEITEKILGATAIQYYVLKPIYDERNTIFVPVNNEKLHAKMHRILSENEIYTLIEDMPAEEPIWIDNENDRKEKYKAILSAGDREKIIQLIKALYLRRKKQEQVGRKLHSSDEHFLQEAEKILYEEIALVLNMQRENVLPFIRERIHAAGEVVN